jgi:acyl-coenzyme A thioesterase PaaI-like protein
VLGFKVASFDPQAAQLRFAMRPELIGHYLHGRLHGGVIAAALDTVGGFAAVVALPKSSAQRNGRAGRHRFGRIGTIDLRTDFLHQGIGKNLRPPAGSPASAAVSPRCR